MFIRCVTRVKNHHFQKPKKIISKIIKNLHKWTNWKIKISLQNANFVPKILINRPYWKCIWKHSTDSNVSKLYFLETIFLKSLIWSIINWLWILLCFSGKFCPQAFYDAKTLKNHAYHIHFMDQNADIALVRYQDREWHNMVSTDH